MSDDDDKPYKGARGPRKTKPRPTKHVQRADTIDNVRRLFGDDDAALAEERLPGRGSGLGPKPAPTAPKKKKRRRRVQVADGWARVLDRVEAGEMTMQEFVKELSPEELVRGRLKAQNGTFVGAPAQWVPADFHRACIRELMMRGKTMYQENYLRTIETMTDLANDPRVDPAQRIRAAQFVIERIEGKVPEKLEISQEQPWQTALAGIVAFVPQGTPMRQFEDGVVTPILEVASERTDG